MEYSIISYTLFLGASRPERNCPSPATCRSGAPRSQYPSCCPGPPNWETAKVAPPPRPARACSRVFSDFRLSEVRSVFAVDSGRLVLVPTVVESGGTGRNRSPTDDSLAPALKGIAPVRQHVARPQGGKGCQAPGRQHVARRRNCPSPAKVARQPRACSR